ncbi:hypothetical protein BX661DRAFT_185068 [Kickxella alabastrina]|uniref:uncharacterized protein n=1 Tax=Kickxella alabastrina TaxID=61397 RepID=UPI00221ED9C8|nr:uncharacterized protein BX661DRAFT_185068 [Kickxella alabastrina]KAI7824989.1 hypothetical protein BX661DRAFT_185068 [Kickxella alabastrina]
MLLGRCVCAWQVNCNVMGNGGGCPRAVVWQVVRRVEGRQLRAVGHRRMSNFAEPVEKTLWQIVRDSLSSSPNLPLHLPLLMLYHQWRVLNGRRRQHKYLKNLVVRLALHLQNILEYRLLNILDRKLCIVSTFAQRQAIIGTRPDRIQGFLGIRIPSVARLEHKTTHLLLCPRNRMPQEIALPQCVIRRRSAVREIAHFYLAQSAQIQNKVVNPIGSVSKSVVPVIGLARVLALGDVCSIAAVRVVVAKGYY